MKKSKAQKVREYMQQNPDMTPAEISRRFKLAPNYIYVIRSQMKKAQTKARKAVAVAAPKPKMDGVDIDAVHKKAYWKSAAAKQIKELAITLHEKAHDPVTNPAHYTDGGVETIDFIEAKGLGYHLGNAVKYISRAGKKGTNAGLEDLKKAQWYITRAIEKNEFTNPTR
jgi:hypothetical protein